jgi:hypothetical protein
MRNLSHERRAKHGCGKAVDKQCTAYELSCIGRASSRLSYANQAVQDVDVFTLLHGPSKHNM